MDDFSQMTPEQKRAWALKQAVLGAAPGAPVETIIQTAAKFLAFVDPPLERNERAFESAKASLAYVSGMRGDQSRIGKVGPAT